MSSKAFIFSLITALALAALYHVFAVGRFSYPEYRLTVGQVADFELIAPFDFPVLKSEKQLKLDRDLALEQLEAPFSVSEQVRFDSFSKLDQLFTLLSEYPEDSQREQLRAALNGLGADPDPAFTALALNPDFRERAYEYIYESISSVYKKPVYENILSDSITVLSDEQLRRANRDSFQDLEAAREAFRSRLAERGYGGFALWLSKFLIEADLVVNQAKFEELKQLSVSAIPASEGEVLQNEIIIRKNSRVTETDINKLKSLTEAYKSRDVRRSPWEQMGLSLGMLLYMLMILVIASYALPTLVPKDSAQEVSQFPINLSFVFLAVLAVINHQILGLNNILIPFALITLSVATLLGFEFGIFLTICNAMVLNPFVNWESYTPVLLLLSTLIALVLIRRLGAWHEYIRMWAALLASTLAVNLALALYKSDPLLTILRNSGYALISSILSVLGAAAVISFFERRWNRSTKQALLELLDFNHPLLKKLATQAVGTYHHSLVVGNLAERAAEAIGANPLLARVGSYYHDIGKVINHEIFTENNAASSEIHDLLDPQESARMIRDHVKEGIILASRYHIPPDVIDIIKEHHGSSKIRYFLDLAERRGSDPNPEDFSYPGPKPLSKEAALVMLADIVESTTKAKNISSRAELEKIIDTTVQRLIWEGQFDEAPITIKDLFKAKQTMLPVLESIYRKRLDYPDENPKPEAPANA